MHLLITVLARVNALCRTGVAALCCCIAAMSILAIAGGGPAIAQPAASAETYMWRPVAIGGGGFITGYDADQTGHTRVIRADVYGAYLWVAAEDRWVQLVTTATMPREDWHQNGAAEGAYEIAVAPTLESRIYMVINGNVYRSDNRGASFARVSQTAPFPIKVDANSEFRHYGSFLAVSPQDPDLVLLGTPDDGLLRSADAGKSWERIDSMPLPVALRDRKDNRRPGILPWFERGAGGSVTGRILAMAAGQGVFVSGDHGKHFAPLVAAGVEQPKTLKQGAFAPDGSFFGIDMESRSVWRFRDGAWSNLTSRPGLIAGKFAFASVAVNPRNGQVFVFDEGGEARRSADGGNSWLPLFFRSRAGQGDPPWLRVSNQSYFATSRVVFDPVIPNRLIVGAGTGVFFADVEDAGLTLTWQSQARGIEELVTNDAVHPPGGAPLFAAWDFGIHRKENLDAFSTTYGPKERVVIAAQQLDWSASDPRFIVTNASDTRRFCCWQDGDSVLAGYSTDGGKSWAKFKTLPQPPGTQANDPWRMSFGSIAVSADSTDNIVWGPAFNRAPFYTRDRGTTWKRVEFKGERLPNTGSHNPYYAQRKILAADRVLPGTFYYYHSGNAENPQLRGLWRTRDGGENWSQILRREIAPQSGFTAKLRAVPGRAGHLFFTAAVASGPDTRLRRSTDGGENWEAIEGVDHVDDVAFGKALAENGYPAIYISGQVRGVYGIWRSTDNAANWRMVGRFPVGTLDQVTVIEADKDHFGRVYVGYKGSGWRYGEVRACQAAPYQFPKASECHAVR